MLIIDILIAEEALVKHFPDMLVLTSPRSLLVAHSIVLLTASCTSGYTLRKTICRLVTLIHTPTRTFYTPKNRLHTLYTPFTHRSHPEKIVYTPYTHPLHSEKLFTHPIHTFYTRKNRSHTPYTPFTHPLHIKLQISVTLSCNFSYKTV
jgi:hypothetical protein